MTVIQQFILSLEIDYCGHPYYVSGNAILHAMADRLSPDTKRQLRVSHGVFAPAQFGKYPAEHSQSGTRPGMGSSLPPVESYADLFLCREPSQSWLLDSRPRDLLNTPDLRLQSGHIALQPETVQVRPPDARTETSTTTWALHGYLHAADDSLLPLPESTLDGLQLGGKRNYGYGMTRLEDTQCVDVDELSFEAVAEADDLLLKLITPYVLSSEVAAADDNDIPWWWEHDGALRRREEQIVIQREQLALETVDHGQVVRYTGDTPVDTAKTGITRTGSHEKYGFGEFRLLPVS